MQSISCLHSAPVPRLSVLVAGQIHRQTRRKFGLAGGDVIALEVKATAAPDADDARHLAWLRDQLSPRFVAGAVLHTGLPGSCPSEPPSPEGHAHHRRGRLRLRQLERLSSRHRVDGVASPRRQGGDHDHRAKPRRRRPSGRIAHRPRHGARARRSLSGGRASLAPARPPIATARSSAAHAGCLTSRIRPGSISVGRHERGRGGPMLVAEGWSHDGGG